MKNVAYLRSQCRGQYYTHLGDHYQWLPVRGAISRVSKKVIVDGRGVGHMSSEVRVYTQNGVKKMRINSTARYVTCEKGRVAYITSRVVGPRFRQGRITGSISRKVLAT